MKISQEGLKALVFLEGSKNKAYQDLIGRWTIGVGHLLTAKELNSGILTSIQVPWKRGLSEEAIVALLQADLEKFEADLNTCVSVPLTQNQYDALCMLAFNIGSGAFRASTLLKSLNAGDYEGVPNQMRQWNRTGGKISRGLTNRRSAETYIWSTGYYDIEQFFR